MKKILLSILCVGIFLSSAIAETVQIADAVMQVEDEGIDVRDARGNHFELGKSEQGNPRIATGYAGSPVGEISFEAVSQDVVRFGIAGQFTDIQRDPSNPYKVYMSNPNGNEKISMEYIIINESTGDVEVIVRDENTGEILSHTKGVKDSAVDSVSNVNGHSQEIHLQKTGAGEDDYSGTMKMKDSQNSADITIVNGEVQKGELSMVEGGYKKEFKLGLGNVEVLLKEAKTNKLKYKLVSKNNYSRLYDASGNLIAEGPDGDEDDDDDEERDMEKIYNQSSYNEFKQIMEADDDEDEIEPPSASSFGNLFGF